MGSFGFLSDPWCPPPPFAPPKVGCWPIWPGPIAWGGGVAWFATQPGTWKCLNESPLPEVGKKKQPYALHCIAPCIKIWCKLRHPGHKRPPRGVHSMCTSFICPLGAMCLGTHRGQLCWISLQLSVELVPNSWGILVRDQRSQMTSSCSERHLSYFPFNHIWFGPCFPNI